MNLSLGRSAGLNRSSRPVKRTPEVPEDSARVTGWLTSIPELLTRPRLLAYLREHKRLRKALFNAVDVLENVALIPSPDVAIAVVGMVWRHEKERFETLWKGRLSEDIGEEHRLYAELCGVLRNVYRNMLLKAGKDRQEFGPHDVQRYDQ